MHGCSLWLLEPSHLLLQVLHGVLFWGLGLYLPACRPAFSWMAVISIVITMIRKIGFENFCYTIGRRPITHVLQSMNWKTLINAAHVHQDIWIYIIYIKQYVRGLVNACCCLIKWTCGCMMYDPNWLDVCGGDMHDPSSVGDSFSSCPGRLILRHLRWIPSPMEMYKAPPCQTWASGERPVHIYIYTYGK